MLLIGLCCGYLLRRLPPSCKRGCLQLLGPLLPQRRPLLQQVLFATHCSILRAASAVAAAPRALIAAYCSSSGPYCGLLWLLGLLLRLIAAPRARTIALACAARRAWAEPPTPRCSDLSRGLGSYAEDGDSDGRSPADAPLTRIGPFLIAAYRSFLLRSAEPAGAADGSDVPAAALLEAGKLPLLGPGPA